MTEANKTDLLEISYMIGKRDYMGYRVLSIAAA